MGRGWSSNENKIRFWRCIEKFRTNKHSCQNSENFYRIYGQWIKWIVQCKFRTSVHLYLNILGLLGKCSISGHSVPRFYCDLTFQEIYLFDLSKTYFRKLEGSMILRGVIVYRALRELLVQCPSSISTCYCCSIFQHVSFDETIITFFCGIRVLFSGIFRNFWDKFCNR